jgi:hypothetical protein
MDTDTGGAITAVAAITTVGTAAITMVGTAATTMVGVIIAIGGEQREERGCHWLAASFLLDAIGTSCYFAGLLPVAATTDFFLAADILDGCGAKIRSPIGP